MAEPLRTSCRPTQLGCKGLLLLAALELAFLATSYNNLFFLLIVFSAVLGVLGHLWARGNLRGIRVLRVEVAVAPAGTPRPVQVALAGRRAHHFDVAVELPGGGAGARVAHVPLLAGQSIASGTLAPQPRSVRTLDRLRLVSRFPFGLFVARREVAVAVEIVTPPLPSEAADPRMRTVTGSGEALAARPGRSAAVAGLRPFRTGDALGDVHWKATARRGTAIVKERERDDSRGVEIVLDRRCAPASLEHALAEIASLQLAARDRTVLRVTSQGAVLRVGRDHEGAGELLRWLAAVAPLPQDAPPPPAVRGALQLPRAAQGRSDG